MELLISGRARLMVDESLTRSALERIAGTSYMHPNGFRKIVLSTAEDGAKLRVHHWPANRPAEASNVHNHRWPFASAVVIGSLRSTLVVVADGRDAVQRFVFEPNEPGKNNTMSPAGVATLAVSHIAEFGAKSSYVVNAIQLHRIQARPGTVSLMLSGPAQRSYTDVFRSAASPTQTRRQTLLSIPQVRESLELLRAGLDAQWGTSENPVRNQT
jgi:hypothetical protein